MKKIVRLTESDLVRLVTRVINEGGITDRLSTSDGKIVVDNNYTYQLQAWKGILWVNVYVYSFKEVGNKTEMTYHHPLKGKVSSEVDYDNINNILKKAGEKTIPSKLKDGTDIQFVKIVKK